MRRIAIIFLGACTVPPRLATLETAETLRSGERSVEVGGGAGGGAGINGSIGGGVARVRDGLGGGQEIGVDAQILWSGSTVVGGAAIAYKRAVADGFAIVAGGGVTGGNDSQATCAAIDAGAIASTSPGRRGLQLYGGARLAAAMPVKGDRYANGGLSQTATIPIGLAVRWGARWRVFVEAGAIGALEEARGVSPGDTAIRTTRHEGGFGALALALTF